MSRFDLTTLHTIQSWRSPLLTTIMKTASWLFTPEVLVPILVVIGILLYFRHRRLQDALFLLLLAGNGLTIILKPIFHRLRPTTAVATIIDHQGGFSLPSGHTVAVTILALSAILLIGQRYRRHRWWITVLAVLLMTTVGLSRVYLGAHWPSDVLAGYVVGILWVGFIWLSIKPLLEHWWSARKIQQLSSTRI